jgi:hypothetical protein
MNQEELFMLCLFIGEFKNDLFIAGKDGAYMPDENIPTWYGLADDFLDRWLRVPYWDREGFWQLIREVWKGGYSNGALYSLCGSVVVYLNKTRKVRKQ